MSLSFSGLWREGTGAQEVVLGEPWETFKETYKTQINNGLRLLDLETYSSDGARMWAGVFRSASGRQQLWVNADRHAFEQKNQEFQTAGLRLSSMTSYVQEGSRWWAGVWDQSNDTETLFLDATWSSFADAYRRLSAQGLRLMDLETYLEEGVRLWGGVFRTGSGKQQLWVNATRSEFEAKDREFQQAGLRLASLCTYLDGAARHWAGVWSQSTGQQHIEVDLTPDRLRALCDELMGQRLRLARIRAAPDRGGAMVRLHFKVLLQPSLPLDLILGAMREVYEMAGIRVELGSVEQLDLPDLLDLDVGLCAGSVLTQEQEELFQHRHNVGPNEMALYFVRSLILENGGPLNGCAAHPDDQAGAILAQEAGRWTLAHEVGHVLGLEHPDDNSPPMTDRLMTGHGTDNITNPPPDLVASEIVTMLRSPYVIHT